MSVFVPSNGSPAGEDTAITNDGFYPNLSLLTFKSTMAIGDVFTDERLTHLLTDAMIEVNESLFTWRAALEGINSFADLPATAYGETSSTEWHYSTAVYNRAKALLIERDRDYDSTKSGHEKADQLEETAGDYQRRSTEALARLMGRARINVELI